MKKSLIGHFKVEYNFRTQVSLIRDDLHLFPYHNAGWLRDDGVSMVPFKFNGTRVIIHSDRASIF